MSDPFGQPQKKKKGMNWLGTLLVILVLVGPQILGALSQILSQITGGPVALSNSLLPLIIVGLLVLIVMSTIVRAIGNAVNQSESSSATLESITSQRSSIAQPAPRTSTQRTMDERLSAARSSTTMHSAPDIDWQDIEAMLQEGTPRTPTGVNPTAARYLSSVNDLPRSTRFEPLISGKVLAYSLAGALVLGGSLALVVVLAGFTP
jgi:hypothetical protein